MIQSRVWVGVDPGRDGAMAMIREESPSLQAEAWPIPMLDDKTYDLATIGDWFRSWRPLIALVTVEKLGMLPPKMFPGGAANFGRGECQGWFWMLAALKIPHHAVRPQTWQAEMHRGASGADTKSRSIAQAKALYPGCSLLASEQSRTFHDGMADAVLLADFGRRNRMVTA